MNYILKSLHSVKDLNKLGNFSTDGMFCRFTRVVFEFLEDEVEKRA